MWTRKKELPKSKPIDKSEDKDNLYEPSISSYISDDKDDGTVEDAVNRLYRLPTHPPAGFFNYVSQFFNCFFRKREAQDIFDLSQNDSQAEGPPP